MTRSRHIWAFLFLLVPVTFYLIVVIYPLLSTTSYFSFTDWNGFSQDYSFVGLDNYKEDADRPPVPQRHRKHGDLDGRGHCAAHSGRPGAGLALRRGASSHDSSE